MAKPFHGQPGPAARVSYRIAFFGTPPLAAAVLEGLLETEGIEVGLVVSQPDRPQGRGQSVKPSAVSRVAREHNLELLTPEHADAVIPRLAQGGVEAVVVAAYGNILSPQLLQTLPGKFVNVHASLLPKYRGASPIAAAILAGDQATGATLMQMDEDMDTGPIIGTPQQVPIEPSDTTGSLEPKLAQAGIGLLRRYLPEFLEGKRQPKTQPQTSERPTSLLKKSDGGVDWSQPAEQIERQVRAYSPWPGSFTEAGDQRIELLQVEVTGGSLRPGELSAGPELIVGTGQGSLRVLKLKPAGKPAMDAGDWQRGYRGPRKFGPA